MKTLLEACADKFDIVDECFIWTGYKSPAGYGIVQRDYRSRKAHKLLYEALVGPVADGLELDHLRKNKACVNPDHLEPVTHHENLLRGTAPAAINARKTHCKRGHEFTPENTYIRKCDGGRECRSCAKGRKR